MTIFCPEHAILAGRIRIKALVIATVLFLLASRGTAGIFGISIPANYGSWFSHIYQLYMDNQDLINNARRAYTAYKAVSNAVDALEGLSEADRAAFGDRWRKHMRVLLEPSIWFDIDDTLWTDGEHGSMDVISQVLGLTFDGDGNVAVDARLIETLAVTVSADPDVWTSRVLDSTIPHLPKWFVTESVFEEVTSQFLDDQIGMAFQSFGEVVQERMAHELSETILENPLWFLNCEGKYTCLSPFSMNGSGRSWTWPEMVSNMFDESIPLHNPMPLPGEIEFNGSLIVGYKQYLYRRICSVIWVGMGKELKAKLASLHMGFRRKRNEINAAVHDIQNLVKFLEDVMTPLESWDPSEGVDLATVVATALDLAAGGAADEQARRESFFHGAIAKRIESALGRTREVQTRTQEIEALFSEVLTQINAYDKKSRNGPDRQMADNILRVTRALSGDTPDLPHTHLGTAVMGRMFHEISHGGGGS